MKAQFVKKAVTSKLVKKIMKSKPVVSTMFAVITLFLSLPCSKICSQVATSDWPVFQGDLKHSGVSKFKGMENSPGNDNCKWEFWTSSITYTSPVIAMDGTVFTTDMSGKVYALDPYGHQKWYYDTGSSIRSTPVLSKDGRIIVATREGFIFSFDVYNGDLRWVFVTDACIHGSCIIDHFGSIIAGSSDGYVYALDKNGILKWKTFVGVVGPVSPCVDSDNNIIIATRSGNLYSLSSNGSMNWNVKIEGDPRSPSLDSEDNIYLPTKADKIFSFTPEGTLRWCRELKYKVRASGAVHPDGYYVIPTYDSKTLVLRLITGNVLMELDANGESEFPPTIDASGNIYVSTSEKFYAFDKNGTLLWSQTPGTCINVSPVMDAEGNFYEVGDGVLSVYGQKVPDVTVSINKLVFKHLENINIKMIIDNTYANTSTYDVKCWYKGPGSKKSSIKDFYNETFNLGKSERNLFNGTIEVNAKNGQYFLSLVLVDHNTGYIVHEDRVVFEVTPESASPPNTPESE